MFMEMEFHIFCDYTLFTYEESNIAPKVHLFCSMSPGPRRSDQPPSIT